MRCPSCGFITFDYLAICKNCGKELPSPPGRRRMSPPGAPPAAQASGLPGPSADKPDDLSAAQPAHPEAETMPMGGEAPAPATESGDAEETPSFDLPPAPSARAPMGASFAPAAVAANHVGADYRPAGFIIRSAAAWADAILLAALMLAVAVAFVFSLGALGGVTDLTEVRELLSGSGRVGWPSLAAQMIVAMAYSVIFVGWRGQTPGKILFRLKIIRVDGSEVDYVTAFIRWIGYWVSLFTLFIGYFIAAFTTNKRALHDYIAGTRVVRL